MPPPPCSTVPPRIHGRSAAPRRGHRVRVGDHEVVVQVGHAASPFAVQREREDADRERLEVVHEVAADESGRVADVGPQQQPRRLERAGGEHDVCSPHLARDVAAGDVEVADARWPAVRPRRARSPSRTTRAAPRTAPSAAPAEATRSGRPWRGWRSRSRRRTRSCCTQDGRRTAPSSRRSGRGTGAARGSQPPPT